MKKVLKVEQIQKYYGNKDNITKAIDGISFDVEEGEFIGIMGASGSGKTTLLNCISTIDIPTSGFITIGGIEITKIKEDELADFRKDNLGFIFQDFNLLDTMTIEENIALSLIVNKEDIKDIDKKVESIAARLGISDILKKFPYEVSGGQKQRIAVARALITKPQILIFDEGTSSLDLKTAHDIEERLLNIDNFTLSTMNRLRFSNSYEKKICN